MSRDPVVDELRGRAAELEGSSPDAFGAAWRATWAWATSPEVAPRLLAALDAPEDALPEGVLAGLQLRALLAEEREETDALLARLGPGGARVGDAITSPFGRATWDRLLDAAGLVDLRACARAVVVGGGPFPAAALYLRDATPAESIEAYDVEPEAVERMERWARWCGDGRLRPRLADGAAADYGGVDLVCVANHASPKPEILARVRDTAPPTVRILLREPVGLGRLVARRGLARPVPGLRVVAEGGTSTRFLSRHVALARTT